MKTLPIALAAFSLGSSLSLSAKEEVQPPVPISQAPAAPSATTTESTQYQQQLYAGSGTIIAPEKARQVVDSFKVAYEKLGKPRLLFYVNRDLVDENSGLKLTGRRERTEAAQGETKSSFESDPNAPKPAATNPQTQINVAVGGGDAGSQSSASAPGKGSSETKGTKVTAENTYTAGEKASATLADRQTVREIERLFGRPFRAAGATLADQKIAASLIADKPIDHFTVATNDVARKDREALAKVADVVIEVLVSSRPLVVAEVSGDQTVPVPDIQVTAIRLSDSAVLGQASASDILGKDRQAGRIVKRFDVRDITEATALALMEDITFAAK